MAVDYLYCPFDGAELAHIDAERRCPRCDAPVIHAGAKFCRVCGAALAV